MNKLNKLIALALVLVGNYTFASDCSPLNGEYTIAADGGDYASVTDAVNDLKCGGISGPVLLRVQTYQLKVHGGACKTSFAFVLAFEVRG